MILDRLYIAYTRRIMTTPSIIIIMRRRQGVDMATLALTISSYPEKQTSPIR